MIGNARFTHGCMATRVPFVNPNRSPKVHTKMTDQRLFSAPTTRNEITLIQRSVLDVAQRSRPARGRVHVTVRWAMTYCQVRGRAASLSPKSRPKIPLPALSALCLTRNPIPAARTVRKTHRFLNGGRVPYDGQDGAAIGCSVAASVCPHRLPYPPHARPDGNQLVSLFCGCFSRAFP